MGLACSKQQRTALVPFIVGFTVACAGSVPTAVHGRAVPSVRPQETGDRSDGAPRAATGASREGTPANDDVEAPISEFRAPEAPLVSKLVPKASYPLATSPFGIWAYVPWCDMVATGVYGSRVLVKPGHLGMGGCNGFGVDCDIEPPAIRCHRIERGLVGCRAPEQIASDRRAAHHSELAMEAASLRIEGRLLVFYAADGAVLFSLHQFIETEGCVNAQAEP